MRQQLQPTCPKVFIYYNWKKSEDKGKGLTERRMLGENPIWPNGHLVRDLPQCTYSGLCYSF